MKSRMFSVLHVLALTTLAVVSLSAVACSSDDASGGTQPATQDAGTGGTADTGGSGGSDTGGSGGSDTGGSGGSDTGGSGGSDTGGSGGSDTGGSGGSAGASACEATDVTGFVPSWTPPQPLYQAVCSDTEIDALVDDCLGAGATQASCQAAFDAAPTCAGCIYTAEDASEYGSIIDYSSTRGYVDRNLQGCYAHAEGDLTANGCGAKVQAMMDCAVEASCAGCLPAATSSDITALNQCVVAAYAGPCKAYADAANACVAGLSGPIADQCPWGASEPFTTMAKRYAHLFCGAQP